MNSLIGKTVQDIRFFDEGDEGILITFTDGTSLRVREKMQAGQIKVEVNGISVKSEDL